MERRKPTRKLNVAAARSCVEDKELPPGRLACLAEYSRTLSLKGSLRIIRSTAFDAASNIRDRRLCDKEYRALGEILEKAVQSGASSNAVSMILLLALTGCRRGEIINLRWNEVDEAKGCFRLRDTKEGPSIRPVGKAAFAVLSTIRGGRSVGYVFPSAIEGKQFVGFPKEWISIFKNSALSDITPHVLRHSFASTANDLGFSEPTIAAMLGHSRGTVTSRYVHHVDAVLVHAADVVASHISTTIRFQRSTDLVF